MEHAVTWSTAGGRIYITCSVLAFLKCHMVDISVLRAFILVYKELSFSL